MDTNFSNVAVFQYSAEAQILKGRLEAEGIKTYLVDNHTIDGYSGDADPPFRPY